MKVDKFLYPSQPLARIIPNFQNCGKKQITYEEQLVQRGTQCMVKLIIITVCPVVPWPGAHCEGGRERGKLTRKLAGPRESRIKP